MTQAANRTEKSGARWYPCPKCGQDHPSATTLLGMIASRALMAWSAKNGVAKLNTLVAQLKAKIAPELLKEPFYDAETAWLKTEDTQFWKSGKQIGIDAADEGIKVDAWIEAHFKGIDIDRNSLNETSNQRIDNFLKWKSEHSVRMIATQETFVNCKLNYAGTADWVGEVDDELTILDWKRSGKVYSNHVCQCWSYALADESQHGNRLYKKIGVGSLGKSDSPITFFKRNDFPSIELVREVMIGCGAIFQLQQEWEKAHPYQRKEETNGNVLGN